MAETADQQVEERRRALRLILSRRDFVTAAGVGVLGLAGCASGDPTGGTVPPPPPPPPPPGTIPDGLTAVTGTVSLPAGSTLQLADLSVDLLTQSMPVSASAAFTIGISSSGPSLALLLDGNGDGVLMSMFDPGAASYAISPRTTAVALLYYGASAHLFPASAMSQILALLNADPAVAALEAAVATAVAADPHALANNAAPLGPAVVQALQTIVGTSLRAAPTPALPNPSTHLSLVQVPGQVPTLMSVSPGSEQNGNLVSQDAVTTSLLISNVKRRGCRVYVYQMGTDTNNTVAPAALVKGPFDLDSTENLGLFTALKDFSTFFHGTSPWSPVNLPAIPLALANGADQTNFTVVILASSWKVLDGNEAPIFRDPHFTGEVGAWRIDNKNMFYASVFGDIIFPAVCFLLGVGTIKASRAVIAQVVLAAAAAKSATFTRIINQLEFGSLGKIKDGLAQVVRDAITSDTSTQFYKAEVYTLIGQAEAKALQAESSVLLGTRLSRASKMFQAVFAPLFAVGAVLEAFDLGAVVVDMYNSELGAPWSVVLIKQKLNLHPNPPDRITPGDRIPFSVSPPANVTGTFQYDWTQSSPFSHLSAHDEVNVGPAITTSDLNVDLQTLGSDTNPINVLVVGYDISVTPRKEIGRAGTTVDFLLPAQILPSAPLVLDNNESRILTVVIGGTPPSPLSYRWTLTGLAGTIGSTTVVTTTVPQVNYISNAHGTDQLHVDVFDQFGVKVAKADKQISVAGPPSIQYTIAPPWDPARQPANGHYSFSDYASIREASPGGGGLDVVFQSWDIDVQNTPGILVTMLLQSGSVFRQGQVFTKFPDGGQGHDGQFQLTLSQNPLDQENSLQWAPLGTGTLKIDVVGDLSDGSTYAEFTFTIINPGGGTIAGTGVGRWKFGIGTRV